MFDGVEKGVKHAVKFLERNPISVELKGNPKTLEAAAYLADTLKLQPALLIGPFKQRASLVRQLAISRPSYLQWLLGTMEPELLHMP